ncbi:MAG: thioredoxin family protein [Verrucomicrobiae bacterium]|nr:thioredoxin family protein [Verrucomicrobiae bacterium]
MRIPLPLLTCGALLGLALSLNAGGEGWTHDFEAAKATATKEKKDLLLDFTGSDWCGWCIRLEKEVFSQQAFKDAAPKDFLLVELDFPQDESKISPDTRSQNEKLSKQFNVEGYPTIILADASGRPYAQTGYQEGGAEAYLTHLAELRMARDTRDAAFAKARSAAGLEKARLLAEGLAPIDPALQVAFYGAELDTIAALDKEDSLGLSRQLGDAREAQKTRESMMALQDKFDRLTGPLMEKINPMLDENQTDAAIKEIDAWQRENKDAEAPIRQQVMLLKVKIYGQAENHASALKALDEVVAIDDKSEMAAALQARLRPAIEKAIAESKTNGATDPNSK